MFFLIGNTIYTMTGKKEPIQIIRKLGHCCSYEPVFNKGNCASRIIPKTQSAKNLFPLKRGKHVLTYFWLDNFDCKTENLKGSIHTTHRIAFHEKPKHLTLQRKVNSITPSDRKTVQVKKCNFPVVKSNPKSPSLEILYDVVSQKDKRWAFSANIGSLKVRGEEYILRQIKLFQPSQVG